MTNDTNYSTSRKSFDQSKIVLGEENINEKEKQSCYHELSTNTSVSTVI